MQALDSRPKRKLPNHHCTVYSKIWAKRHTFGHANGTSQRAIWQRRGHRLSLRCRTTRRKNFDQDRRVLTLTIRITFWMTVTPHIRFSIKSYEKVILTIELDFLFVTRRSQIREYETSGCKTFSGHKYMIIVYYTLPNLIRFPILFIIVIISCSIKCDLLQFPNISVFTEQFISHY